MSDSLKQDLIKSIGIDNYIRGCKQIDQMYEDAEKGICSNIQIDTTKELSLYNVQFDIPKFDKHYIKFVFARDMTDAIDIVMKKYRKFNVDVESIHCQYVDIKRGMMFNV